jgi:hypothetical protein
MTDLYYKIYPKFSCFAQELSQLDLEDESDYRFNGRNDIYDRLRLPMRTFQGEKEKIINNLIEKYFGLKEDFLFSVIASDGTSKIHTDTYYKKEPRLQRYCNLAFPVKGNLENRMTVWPELTKKDSVYCFRNSFVDDKMLRYYSKKENWLAYVEHQLYQPVLLNTSLPHAAQGDGTTLFAYITLQGKSYKDCVALYDAISNSATI